LQDFDSSKRQQQEEIVKMTLGSIYEGKALYYGLGVWVLRRLFQLVQTPFVLSDNHSRFLLTPIIDIETVSSMYSLFLVLVLFPQVQRRAQAELDAVIGRDRLPMFDDRPRLPYIEAFCKELMRWNMVTPTGTSFPESHESE